MRRRLARVGMALLLLASLLPALAVWLYGRSERAAPAEVIIVLGAGLERNNRPGQALTRRARHAAELYRRGMAGHVICTGGVGAGRTRSEAAACGELLQRDGVPAEAILHEERSRSTEENALYARQLLEAGGWREVLLVSDGYHLLRAQWLFSRLGIAAGISPAPDPPPHYHLFYTLREVAALYWLGFRYLFDIPEIHFP